MRGWAGPGRTKHNQKHINLELPPPRQQQRTHAFNPHISQLRHNSGTVQEEWCARNLSIWGTQRAGRSVMYIYPGSVVSSSSLFPTFLVKNAKISGVSFTKGALWVISLISALIALCQDTFCSSFQPFSAPHKERKNPLKYREWRQWIFWSKCLDLDIYIVYLDIYIVYNVGSNHNTMKLVCTNQPAPTCAVWAIWTNIRQGLSFMREN